MIFMVAPQLSNSILVWIFHTDLLFEVFTNFFGYLKEAVTDGSFKIFGNVTSFFEYLKKAVLEVGLFFFQTYIFFK